MNFPCMLFSRLIIVGNDADCAPSQMLVQIVQPFPCAANIACRQKSVTPSAFNILFTLKYKADFV